ncbi:PKD domain-containing protein [Micromonospora echinaurantiaca]|uniref:PKD domain-containing protein n=1 Tax=Micromonospora echinaurantiaca TaxID=47857 RepID=UPI00341B2F8C
MVRRTAARLAVAVTGAIALVVGTQTAAVAAPTNDDYSAAIAVESLPFTTTIDTSAATSDETDPTGCYNNGSVWFSFTPTRDMRIQADTIGSDYDTALSAWTGDQGSLTQVACNDNYYSQHSRVALAVTAGTTYRFMAGYCCGNGRDGGGSLRFSITEVRPPANDDFAGAIPVGALPYANTQDYQAATPETGEPSSCFTPTTTAWYSYTATTTGSVTARTDPGYAGIAVYTGTSLANLARVGCSEVYSYRPLTFRAEAGRTYLFQVAAAGINQHTFQLDVAPPPTVEFYYYPDEPSSFDAIPFSSSVGDYAAGGGISSYAWDFGDGTTSTEANPVHRLPADGDYPVRLTVGTPDGRSASVTHVVRVRTHDVAIVGLTAPTKARVGQTITVDVDVRNTRYEETVQVSLYRSTASGGYDLIGSSTQPVPVKDTGKTTRFSFTYTVTSADLALGKLTLRATADPSPNRDALLVDNELISTPIVIR